MSGLEASKRKTEISNGPTDRLTARPPTTLPRTAHDAPLTATHCVLHTHLAPGFKHLIVDVLVHIENVLPLGHIVVTGNDDQVLGVGFQFGR